MKKLTYFLAAIFIFVAVAWAGVTHWRSTLAPHTDNSVDIGTSTLEWKDGFFDGTVHIDVLDVDETAGSADDITVGASGSSKDIIVYDVNSSTQSFKIEVIDGTLTATKL